MEVVCRSADREKNVFTSLPFFLTGMNDYCITIIIIITSSSISKIVCRVSARTEDCYY